MSLSDKTIKKLTSKMNFRWKNVNELPKLGKLILVESFFDEGICEFIEVCGEHVEVVKVKSKYHPKINTVPDDIFKYRFFVGYLSKSNENKLIFTSSDILEVFYNEGKVLGKTFIFDKMHIRRWVYIEDIINL